MNPEFKSQSMEIQLALRHETVALKVGGLNDDEIQARVSYYMPDTGPFQGITIHDIGETYGAGTLGTHDVGYKIAFTFVDALTNDAIVATDWLLRWREAIRRRFVDQRLPASEDEGIMRHNIRMLMPAAIENAKNFPNHRIHRVAFAVWNRESARVPRT